MKARDTFDHLQGGDRPKIQKTSAPKMIGFHSGLNSVMTLICNRYDCNIHSNLYIVTLTNMEKINRYTCVYIYIYVYILYNLYCICIDASVHTRIYKYVH